jgi:hypothetical protein
VTLLAGDSEYEEGDDDNKKKCSLQKSTEWLSSSDESNERQGKILTGGMPGNKLQC